MHKKAIFFLFLLSSIAYSQDGMGIPSLGCGECYPSDDEVPVHTLSMTRTSSSPCKYTARAVIRSNIGPVSIALSGSGFSKSDTTIFSRNLTLEEEREVSPGPYNVVAGMGYGASFAQGCRECRSGNFHCSDPAETSPGGCETGDEPPSGGPVGKAADDCIESPILIDLNHDGFQLSGAEGAIRYDILGDGHPPLIHWVEPGTDDVFLFQDINGNGLADDGSELFGNGTRMRLFEDDLAANGFVGLSQFDDPILGGNNEGSITDADEIWSDLLLWNDANADGVCQTFEVMTLASKAFTEFETIPHDLKRYDEHENWLRFWAKAQRSYPTPRNLFMVDVFFRVLER